MSHGADMQPRMTSLVWWIGVVVATGLVVAGVPKTVGPRPTAGTPFDATGTGHAEQWRFLDEVSSIVPEGSTLTIHAADAGTEMSLFMMAVGLVPQATVVPRSYYGRPVAGSESARFVATFGAEPGDSGDSTVRVVVAGGCVTDRGSPDP